MEQHPFLCNAVSYIRVEGKYSRSEIITGIDPCVRKVGFCQRFESEILRNSFAGFDSIREMVVRSWEFLEMSFE